MRKIKSLLYLILPFCIILWAGCNTKNSKAAAGFIIKGKVKNINAASRISINELTNSGLIILDTSLIEPDGSFLLNGNLTEKTFCMIRFDKGDVLLLVDTSSELTVDIDANKIDAYTVQGSKENTDLKTLYLLNANYLKMMQQLGEKYSAYQNGDLPDSIQIAIRKDYDEVRQEQKKAIKEYTGSIKNSLVPYFATSFLLPEADFNFLNTVDKNLYAQYGQSKYALQLHLKVEELRKTAEGVIAPNIVLNDPFGKTTDLASLRGKIVLIDFWASWCKPCRDENPNNVILYHKYKAKGFDIFGVSLDDNREAWINAINKDKLLWPHASDLLKWNSPLVRQYNIESIPATFLLDKEGKIIGRNLFGKELAAKLQIIFGY
ncbi:MAG: AhpC/TSA family protein [Bacteroidia bacterium]|nr:AhpC/TSA family protein [Bacteroidia bacterium]